MEMKTVTQSIRVHISWKKLYMFADDLIFVEKSKELKEMKSRWDQCLMEKGLKVNNEKTSDL